MFEPSSEAILWILGSLATMLSVIVLITIVAVIFIFMGPPDINEIDIDGNPRKETKK